MNTYTLVHLLIFYNMSHYFWWWHVWIIFKWQKFTLGCCLSSAWIFANFKLALLITVAYKKKPVVKLSEGDMIHMEACYYESWMAKFRNKFCGFSNDQENHLKDFQKYMKLLQLPSECNLLKILSKVVMKLHLS